MNKKSFYIPQIEEEKNDKKEEKVVENKQTSTRANTDTSDYYKTDKFVSPIFGTRVKDDHYYPYTSYQNGGKQYDSFRDADKQMNKNDYSGYVIDPNTVYQGQSYQNNQNYQNSQGYQNNQNYQNNNYSNNQNPYAQPYQDYASNIKNPNSTSSYTIPVQNPYVSRQEEVEQVKYNQVEDSRFNDNNYNPYRDVQEENIPTYDEITTDTNDVNVDNYSPYVDTQEERVVLRPQVQEDKNSKQVKPKLEKKQKYFYPPVSILKKGDGSGASDMAGINRQRDIIDNTLKEFGIGGHVVKFTKGPTVTLFEVQCDPGVKYNKIPSIQYNLQGNLEALSIRIEAPIPGKATVGIEVPNASRDTVFFGDMMSEEFLNDGNPLNVVLGKDISGENVYLNIQKMPHGLIAGCTGSGKSVCVNGIIASILYKAHPDDVKLILVDPKKVEFARFNGIPHLATPIITDNKLAAAALKWAVDEMENRYELMSSVGAVNYKEYLETIGATNEYKHMPYIVIIIDEMADLIVSGADVEDSIARLTAKARAAGIHLLVATQRPSVNVINGTIKTNIPSRIAFKVNKSIDSNIILDRVGAEKLLGNGDMLYDEDSGRQRRIQGAFISPSEIRSIVSHIEENYTSEFLFSSEELNKRAQASMGGSEADASQDELFASIAHYIVSTQNASINNIQKKFGCGFNRVQSIVQKLEELGVVGENVGSRARSVLMTEEDLDDVLANL